MEKQKCMKIINYYMKEILKIIDLKERENYIYKHGVYYIGEFKNNERNGKGKEYYPNGKL